MDWLGEFFRAIPDAVAALWDFGGGLYGLVVTLGSIALAGVLLFGAKMMRDRAGWISAILGGMATTIVALWIFGVLPSAWIYFVDGSKDVLQDRIVPASITPGGYALFTNFYQVFRDSVVMMETIVAMAGFTALALYVQRKLPKSLTEGEEARPQSGGYK